MPGLTNGLKYLSAIQKAILGSGDWQDALLDYFEGAGDAVLRTVFQHSGFIGAGANMTISGGAGSRELSFAAGTHRVYANGRLLVFTPATSGCSAIPYDEGALQYIGVQGDTYPNEVDITSDGVKFLKRTGVGVGKTYTPTTVAVDGAGLKITLPLSAWTKAAGTRPVVAWLETPETGSSEAIYTGTAVLEGGAIVVNVTHQFGQAVPSVVAADYSVFVAGPVLQVGAIDETLAAAAAQANAGSVGTTDQVIIRSLDQIETSLDLLEQGPAYVGTGCEYATIAAAIADGRKHIVVTGPNTAAATIDVPADTTIESVGPTPTGNCMISWGLDTPLFSIADPQGVIIRNLYINPTHTAALPAAQTRLVFQLTAAGGSGVEAGLIENIVVAKGSHANGVCSGVILATGFDFAEYLVIRDVEAWFGDFGIDIGGTSRVYMENIRLRRSGAVAQSAGALKFGVRVNGSADTSTEEGRISIHTLKVYGPDSGDTAPDFTGPGFVVGDTAATIGLRAYDVQVYDVTDQPGVSLGANCDDCMIVGGDVDTRDATIAVEITGTRCALQNVKARATITGSCAAIYVNGKRALVNNCDAKATATVAGVGIQITGTPASDFSIVTGCQTNGSTLSNSNGANTTAANNRDDA